MSIIQGPAPVVHFDDGMFDGDAEFQGEIVNLFLETCPDLLSGVEDAVTRMDAPALRRAAHTLKGSVANFGAPLIVKQAQELEMIGLDGDLTHADQSWRALQSLMKELLSELRAELDRLSHG